MSGKLSDANAQIRNAESSVLFLQQQHAKTLEGLYSEISKLQKKCGELTFQMAMNSTCLTPDEENHREKCLRTEKELKKKEVEVVGLGELLENKSKHNSLLERNLRTAEENFEDTMRKKHMEVASLTAELDDKAGTIAHLTNQLHTSKVAFAELNDRLPNQNTLNMQDREVQLSPAPPGQKPPVSGRRRFVRKATNGAEDDETFKSRPNPSSRKILFNIKTAKSSEGFPARSVRGKTPTPKNGRHARSMGEAHALVSGQSRLVPDDYTEFLKTGVKPEPKLVYKPVPNPLPPIVNGVDSGATSQGAYKVHRSRSSQGVVDGILVSPLNSPDKSWRQGSNQYDPVS